MKSEEKAISGRAARRRSIRRQIIVGGVLAVHRRQHRIRARLHRQMQKRHQLFDLAMGRDQIVVHVAGMAGGVADARHILDGGNGLRSAAPESSLCRRVPAAIGIDVLAQQHDLARALAARAARFRA